MTRCRDCGWYWSQNGWQKYAPYFFCNLYDTYRIWYIPPLAREYMRSADLSFVLGSVFNHSELLDLIYDIDYIYWSEVPLFQAMALATMTHKQVTLKIQATLSGLNITFVPLLALSLLVRALV